MTIANITMPNEIAPIKLAPEETASAVKNQLPRLHLDFLDGLRALAALSVIIDHAYCVLWWDKQSLTPQGGVYLLGYLQLLGHFAVSVFIVLSGFCLMLPVVRGDMALKGGAKTFFRKRVRRILPPYYFALGVSLLLIATLIGKPTHSHWDPSIAVDKAGILTHLLLIHNLFPHTVLQINNALWSVAVEWQIYFLFPLLVLLWRRWGGGVATLLAIGCGYSLYLIVRYTSFAGLNAPYLGLFALGALGAAVAYHPHSHYQRIRERFPSGTICLLLAATVVLICYRITWPKAQEHLAVLDFLVGVAAMLLLVVASSSRPTIARKALSWRPLAFLGTFSYSIYLIHVPIQQLFWQYALRPLHLQTVTTFVLLVLMGTPFILGSAYLFYLCCERPFLNTSPRTT